MGTPAFLGDGGVFDTGEGVRVEAFLAQVVEQRLHDLDRFVDVIALKVRIEAEHAAVAKALALYRWPVGQTIAQAQLVVQRPVQVA
ncbi:hypothetical protein D3C81_2090780 [compost metagenome]